MKNTKKTRTLLARFAVQFLGKTYVVTNNLPERLNAAFMIAQMKRQNQGGQDLDYTFSITAVYMPASPLNICPTCQPVPAVIWRISAGETIR